MPSKPFAWVPGLRRDVDLQSLNTFGLPCRAAALIELEHAYQLGALMTHPDWREVPRLVLGGGSNVVLQRDFPGLVVKVAMHGCKVVGEDREHRYVRAGAGENWHAFVRWTLAQGMPGLENLSLIPGTVGAAPIQNIGAYGIEMAERFESLEAISLTDGEQVRFDARGCAFGYRDSIFKREAAGRFLIVAVTFRLPRRWSPLATYADVASALAEQGIANPTAVDISDVIVAVRQRKLPAPEALGNAGSFFKNPIVDAVLLGRLRADHGELPHYPQADGTYKLAAGWLIEACGWKGRNLGPVGCFEGQALVLVNRGGATGADVARAAGAIQTDVEARFGVRLEPEPTFI